MTTALRWQEVEPYGRVSVPGRSRWHLPELMGEVGEYFACGATLSRGAVVFDVGANIGAFALAAASRCDRELELFCFEPVPPIYGALSANSRMNPWLSGSGVTTHLFPVAVGSGADLGDAELSYFRRFPTDSTCHLDSKRLDFESYFAQRGSDLRRHAARVVSDAIARPLGALVASIPRGPLGRWMSDTAMGRVVFRCPTTTLSRVIEESDVERIDLLKIDVEGAELDVLRGVAPHHWRRIRQVVLEGHDHHGELREISELLRAQGFSIASVEKPGASAERGLPSFLLYARREP